MTRNAGVKDSSVMSRFVTIVAVLMVAAAGLAKPVTGSASCAAGLVFDGDFYAQIGPLKSSDLARRLDPGTIPPCNDVIVGVDPQGKTVTDPPPPSPSVAVRPRAVRGISPRLAVAMPAGGGFALAVKGGACHNRSGVPDILACLRRRSGFHLQVDPTITHPGDKIRLRVSAPAGARARTDATAFFSGKGDGATKRDFTIILALPPGGHVTTTPNDGSTTPTVTVRVPAGVWQEGVVPNVAPGSYRIMQIFGSRRLLTSILVVA